jgi:hypothetical protein
MGNMDFADFLWLMHGILCIGYVFTIGYFLWSRFIGKREMWEQIYDLTDPHNNPKNMDEVGNLVTLLIGVHVVWYGIAIGQVPFGLIILILAFGFCVKRLADVEYIFKNVKQRQRLARRGKLNTAQPSSDDFESEASQNDDDDDFFERVFGSRSGSASSSAPNGSENLTPQEAALWAKANDSGASDDERLEAFKMRLKKERQRKGYTSREIVKPQN